MKNVVRFPAEPGKRLDKLSFRCPPELRDSIVAEAAQKGTTPSDLICTIALRHTSSHRLLGRRHPLCELCDEIRAAFECALADGRVDHLEGQDLTDLVIELAHELRRTLMEGQAA